MENPMKVSRLVLIVLAFGLLLFALPVPAAAQAATAAPGPIQTVWIILLENHNWSQILGSKDAPQINTTLLPMPSAAQHSFHPPSTHPTLPTDSHPRLSPH